MIPWGDNFYNPKTNKFTRKNKTNELDRCFVQFIMHPIKKMISAVIDKKKNKKGKLVYKKLCSNMGIELKKEELEWEDSHPKKLLKAIMQKWMPAAESLAPSALAAVRDGAGDARRNRNASRSLSARAASARRRT